MSGRHRDQAAKPAADAATASSAAKAWRRLDRRPVVVAVVIWAVLLGVYHLDGGFLYGNDAKPNVYLPAALLAGEGFAFPPEDYPFMYMWGRVTERGLRGTWFNSWDERPPDQPYTYRQLRRAGRLVQPVPKYYLTQSVYKTQAGEPICVNTFGPGAGMTALPVFAVLHLAVGEDLREHPAVLWYGGKFVAALLVAGSAAFVFLTARRFVATGPALLIAAAYGLGTSVWSTSSQTLWQHGPNEFFLAMGAYFLTRAEDGWKYAAACGGALSAAVACRPTSVVVAAAVAVYLAARLVTAKRKALIPYVLAAVPIAVALGSYNAYYLGSPFTFGQEKVGHNVAQAKTGSRELWQTPLAEGATGLMVSPSRGLLVFSPFMVFALVGGVMLWTDKRYAVLWPLAVGMVILLGIAFKWFDWWGGWCYGPRPIVDTMPFFALMLIPVIDWVVRRKAALAVFGVLVVWSVGVQVVGAFAYDMFGWNKKQVAEVYLAGREEPIILHHQSELDALVDTGVEIGHVRFMSHDIDEPAHRHRLWSWRDSQIVFYVKNFAEAREVKMTTIQGWLENPCR